jgi:hypothetical protein
MAAYRACLVGVKDQVFSSRLIEADSDERALEIAKQSIDGCDVEVWRVSARSAASARSRTGTRWFVLEIS